MFVISDEDFKKLKEELLIPENYIHSLDFIERVLEEKPW